MSLIEVPVPDSASPAPFLRPTVPPPGRFSTDRLPQAGAWVRVIASEGSFTGRVVFAEADRIRLKEGAGFWDVDTAGILSLSEVEAPTKRLHAGEIERREQRRQHRLVARLLDRWP